MTIKLLYLLAGIMVGGSFGFLFACLFIGARRLNGGIEREMREEFGMGVNDAE